MKTNTYLTDLQQGLETGPFRMTQFEYREEVLRWMLVAERNGIRNHISKPLPMSFYYLMTMCAPRTHQQLFGLRYHTSGEIEPNKKIPKMISQGVFLLSLLSEEELAKEIELKRRNHLPELPIELIIQNKLR